MKVHPHFVRHLAAGPQYRELSLASLPDTEGIEALVNAAFWASLRRIEGYVPRISLALLPSEQAEQPLMFERPLPVDADALTQLAPAIERPGIHLGVWREQGELRVWGTTRTIPTFCFVLEVVAPGLLVIKHRNREEWSKYANVAVLEGDQIKIVKQDAESMDDAPALLNYLLGFDAPSSSADSVNVLAQLATSMRAHAHGGLLLVVPAGTDVWRESILHPIPYSVHPPFCQLADLMRENRGDSRERRRNEAISRAVEVIAGSTAVDGATVMTDRYELLAFGAKIGRRQRWPRVRQVVVTEPIEDTVRGVANPAQLGGTRHLSAAQFGQDQPDAFALVASQDGRFTVFAWSPREGMVHAHRVEALLL